MSYLLTALFDPIYWLYIVLMLSLSYFFLRKHITSLVDPLLQFVIWVTFSSAVVFYLTYQGAIRPFYSWAYLYLFFFFLIGFFYALRKIEIKARWRYLQEKSRVMQDGVPVTLAITLLMGTLVVMTIFAIRWKTVGLAIFSANPLLDRFELAEKNRFFDAFNYVTYTLVTIATLLYWNYKKWHQRIILLMILAMLFLTMLAAGSRAALLRYIVSIGAGLVLIRVFEPNFNVRKIGKIILLLLLPMAFTLAILLMVLSGMGEAPLLDLAIRFAGYGDTYIYLFYFDNLEEMQSLFHPFGYFLHTLFNRLGMSEQTVTMGSQLFGMERGDYSGFGPNPHYITEALVLFGIPLGAIYAFAIGSLVAVIRFLPQILWRNFGYMRIFFAVVMLSAFDSLPVDSQFFQTTVLSNLIFLGPMFLTSALIVQMTRKSYYLKQFNLNATQDHATHF